MRLQLQRLPYMNWKPTCQDRPFNRSPHSWSTLLRLHLLSCLTLEEGWPGHQDPLMSPTLSCLLQRLVRQDSLSNTDVIHPWQPSLPHFSLHSRVERDQNWSLPETSGKTGLQLFQIHPHRQQRPSSTSTSPVSQQRTELLQVLLQSNVVNNLLLTISLLQTRLPWSLRLQTLLQSRRDQVMEKQRSLQEVRVWFEDGIYRCNKILVFFSDLKERLNTWLEWFTSKSILVALSLETQETRGLRVKDLKTFLRQELYTLVNTLRIKCVGSLEVFNLRRIVDFRCHSLGEH